jgi:methyl acetate hydrolase
MINLGQVRAFYFIILYSIIFRSASIGQNRTGMFPDQDFVNRLMDAEISNNDLPSVVAIAINTKNQELIYLHGKAVWSQEEKVTPNHIFQIMSMTKVLTSIAALQLVEKGLVGMDDDLSLWLPEMAAIPILSNGKLAKAKNPITLRHLLTHTAGFGYRGTDKELAGFKIDNWNHKDLPRRFESGTKFLYGSSTNWVGKLVEKITKTDLENYFRKYITGPLNMDRTWFNVPDSLKQFITSRGARGYDGKQPLTELPNRIRNGYVTEYAGDGGLYSSPHDYTLLLKCLLNYGTLYEIRILKKETILEMSKNQIGNIAMEQKGAYFDPGNCCSFNGLYSVTTKWGLAWMIDNEDKTYGPRAGTVLWGGSLNTFFYIDFESGIAASIYTQHRPFNHPATTLLFNRFSEILYFGK